MTSFNLNIQKGVTFILPIVIWNDNKVTRKNLTGFTAELIVKNRLRDGNLDETMIVELTTENGGITLGGLEGTVDILIDATDTALLPTTTTAYYDLKLINGDVIETALFGNATIKETAISCY